MLNGKNHDTIITVKGNGQEILSALHQTKEEVTMKAMKYDSKEVVKFAEHVARYNGFRKVKDSLLEMHLPYNAVEKELNNALKDEVAYIQDYLREFYNEYKGIKTLEENRAYYEGEDENGVTPFEKDFDNSTEILEDWSLYPEYDLDCKHLEMITRVGKGFPVEFLEDFCNETDMHFTLENEDDIKAIRFLG